MFSKYSYFYIFKLFNKIFIFQLSSTKDVENKTTVLHYLVDIIEKKYPELLNFADELPHLDRASKISIETIQKTMTQMRNDLKNLQTDINNCKSLPKDDDDKFEEVMTVSFSSLPILCFCKSLFLFKLFLSGFHFIRFDFIGYK